MSGAQTTEHKERAMKVFCFVMNGALDCHHLRAVDRLLERETQKDKTDRDKNTTQIVMENIIVHVTFHFSWMMYGAPKVYEWARRELLTFRCGLELFALLFPPPLPRLEKPAQR